MDQELRTLHRSVPRMFIRLAAVLAVGGVAFYFADFSAGNAWLAKPLTSATLGDVSLIALVAAVVAGRQKPNGPVQGPP